MFRVTEHTPAMPANADRTASAGDRVVDVLDAFSEDPSPKTLDEIRSRTGLSRTTTHRILTMLTRRHWLEHTPRGYRPGSRGQALGGAPGGLEALRAAAAGPLNELHLASRAVAHLTVLDGPTTCHVDKVGGRAWGEIPSAVGVRLPVTDTAAGRSILAYLPPERVDALVAMLAESGNDRVDRAELDAALAAARRNHGVVTRDGGQRPSQISTAAAPVLGPDGPVAAVSVAWRRTGPEATRAAGLVARTARQIRAELYPDWVRSRPR